MARSPKAILYKSTRRIKKKGKYFRQAGFRIKMKGLNGEPVGSGQFYIDKDTAISTMAKYYPNFDLVDTISQAVSKAKGVKKKAAKR